MSHKKTYIIPERMHYDVYEISYGDVVHVASCAKEADAQFIAGTLARHHANYGHTAYSYKVRARPTVEHTIHRFSSKDFIDAG